MRDSFKFKFLLILIFTILINLSPLAEENKLEIKISGYLVKKIKKDNNEKEILVPLPKEVYPNNIIEYHIFVKNKSSEILKKVKILGKIPKGTVYIDKSASDLPQFSIDNGKTFYKPPIKYMVIENGKKIEKIAKPDMYTNILWTIKKLEPKQSIILKYRVNVK